MNNIVAIVTIICITFIILFLMRRKHFNNNIIVEQVNTPYWWDWWGWYGLPWWYYGSVGGSRSGYHNYPHHHDMRNRGFDGGHVGGMRPAHSGPRIGFGGGHHSRR